MDFPTPLIEATLLQRYKRFLADVRLEDGREITVHCPNPGSMMGLKDPGNRVWISDSGNPKRKLRHTLELMETPSGTLVGINTNLPNKLAREAIETGLIPALSEFDTLRPEVKYGENSRIDMLLSGAGIPDTYVEVKNVHLVRKTGLHEFPDSVTSRGAKHLNELAMQVRSGNRAVMVYLIQRADGDTFRLARDLDPAYAAAFDKAVSEGVECFAVRCDISTRSIVPERLIEIDEKSLQM